LTADVTLVWRFRVFHGLVLKKFECRKAGTGATWTDPFLLAESSEPQEFLLALQGAPSLPRLCGKDGDLTYVDLARLKRSGRVGRRPRALDWHVFDVRSDVPLVAEIILYCGVAVTVGLIRWFLE
jgi:hypothetical protein